MKDKKIIILKSKDFNIVKKLHNNDNRFILNDLISISKSLDELIISSRDHIELYCRSLSASFLFLEKVLKNSKTKDPSRIAYEMVSVKRSKPEWAKKIIENAICGNPSQAAYYMALNYYASKEWAESIIENDKIGEPSWAAYLMVCNRGSSKEWAYSVFGSNSIDGEFLQYLLKTMPN